MTVTIAGAVPLPAGLKYFPDVASPAPGNTTSYYDHRFDANYLEVNDDYELPCTGPCAYGARFLLTTVTNGAHPVWLYLRLSITLGGFPKRWTIAGTLEWESFAPCHPTLNGVVLGNVKGYIKRPGWPDDTLRDELEGFDPGDRVWTLFATYVPGGFSAYRDFALPCSGSLAGNYTFTQRAAFGAMIPKRDAACALDLEEETYSFSPTNDPGDIDETELIRFLADRELHAADISGLTCTVAI